MVTEQRQRTGPLIPLAVARWAGRVLIVAAVLAVLWPPFVEWGGRRWSWPVAGAIGLGMVAAAVLLDMAALRPPRRRVRPVPAVVGAGATVAGMVVAALVMRAAGLPVTADSTSGTVVLAILVAAALVVGWPLVAISMTPEDADGADGADGADSGPPPPAHDIDPGRSQLRPVVVIAVLVTLGTLLVAASSNVHRETAHPLGGLAPQPPDDVSRERWSGTVGGRVLSGGRYLVVDLDGGVEVRDALTGQPRWQYRRTDDTFSQAVVSGDGRTVVVIWPDQERPVAAAFDLATGVQRWAGNLPALSPVSDGYLPTRAVSAGRVLVLFAGTSSNRTGDGFALDIETGDLRWRVPEPPEPACEQTETVAAADTVAVAYQCGDVGGGGSDWQVVGLSAADGRVRWSRPTPGMSLLSLRGHGARVYQFGLPTAMAVRAPQSCETMVLDAATGAEQARHIQPSGGCSTPIIGDGVVGYAGQPHGFAGLLTGVDQQTGQLRWTATLPNQVPKAIVVASAVFGSTAYLLYGASLDATDVDLVILDLVSGAVSIHRNRSSGARERALRAHTLLLAPGRLILVSAVSRDVNDERRAVTVLG